MKCPIVAWALVTFRCLVLRCLGPCCRLLGLSLGGRSCLRGLGRRRPRRSWWRRDGLGLGREGVAGARTCGQSSGRERFQEFRWFPKTIKGETDGSGYLIEIGQKRTTVLNLAILIRWRHQVAGECKACSHSLQLLGSDL